MDIKVCGPGCPKCHATEKAVREALAEAGVSAEVTMVKDFQDMAKLGVFATPAVVIDGQVKVSGKVPSKDDVLAWFGK